MRLRPALVLAAPAGVLGGHAIGYLAGPGPAGAAALHHGYLALVLAVAVPLAVLAAGWAATDGARQPGPARPLPLGPLLVAQWVLFTGQELVEHAVSGHGAGAVLHSPALWWGLAAQVLTAVATVTLLRASAATGARLVSLSVRCPDATLPLVPWRPPALAGLLSSSPVRACPSRGPPAAGCA